MEWKMESKTDDMTVYTCGDGLFERRYVLMGMMLCNGKIAWKMRDTVVDVTASVNGLDTAFDDFLIMTRMHIQNCQKAEQDLGNLMKKEA